MYCIRNGILSDVESVLALWSAAEAEPTHTDTTEHLGQLIRHDPFALFVAKDEGLLVGSVVAGWDGWRGSIDRLVVAPSHRRLGLGSHLLDAAESRLASIDATRLQAIVVDTEPLATAFWRPARTCTFRLAVTSRVPSHTCGHEGRCASDPFGGHSPFRFVRDLRRAPQPVHSAAIELDFDVALAQPLFKLA
jgi:GNAT superfamily N-acetyltransferase